MFPIATASSPSMRISYSDNGFWRNINYFDYTFLRNAFRTALLNEMEPLIGPSFKKVPPVIAITKKASMYMLNLTNVILKLS